MQGTRVVYPEKTCEEFNLTTADFGAEDDAGRLPEGASIQCMLTSVRNFLFVCVLCSCCGQALSKALGGLPREETSQTLP